MLDEKYIVEKSKALVWAQFQDYSTGELKILDTYLSRIDARNPNSSRVTFTKKEYAEMMGLDANIRTEQLKAYTRGLLSNVVTIELPEVGYLQYPLFSEAKCYLDDKNGQISIDVDCNHNLKEAFFDLANNGYVRYQLKNIISLKSQYSVRLYPKLKDRLPYGWTVKVEELREILGATASSYDEFKEFNKHVVQKAIKEINKVTDITVTTKNIRKGKFVASIKFDVAEKENHVISKEDAELFSDAKEIEVREEQAFFAEVDNSIPDPDDRLALCASALPSDFTREQVELLRSLALDHLPFTVATIEEKELWLHDYLDEKTKLMRATPNIHNQFAWLRGAVKEDWQ